MLSLPFDSLRILKQYRSEYKDHEINIIGYDTETVDGQCQLLANSWGDYINPTGFDSIVSFLCRDLTRSYIGMWYNMKYDFQAILKWLPSEDWLTIHQTGELRTKTFKLHYIPQKMFSIQLQGNKKRQWKFFDISQYFGKRKLNTVAFEYFNEKKDDISGQYDITNVTMEYCKDPVFIDYCIKDCVLTERLGYKFVEICESMNLRSNNFCSPASISAEYFKKTCRIPTINRFVNNPDLLPLLRYPWNSISGAFISVFKRGYFEKVHVYDINSSYPTRIRNMPNLDYGSFFTDDGIPDDDYHMGWMHVSLHIDPSSPGWYTPPVPIKRTNNSNYFPIGTMDVWITLSEYRFLRHCYDIEVIGGLYWQPDELVYPFKDEVDRLFKMKAEVKESNPDQYQFIKIALNGLYGKFLQRVIDKDPDSPHFGTAKAGNMFNPFYASYILADSRIALFEQLIDQDQSDLIACFTDSIMTKKPISIDLDSKLGGWSLETEGEAVVIGCGVYCINTGKYYRTKLRGFNTVSTNLFEVIERQSQGTSIDMSTLLNISPITAIIQKDPESMNRLIQTIRKININFDTKRLWERDFKNAGDLLKGNMDSVPLLHE